MVADMSELVAQMKAQEPRKTGRLIHRAGRGWYMPKALGYTSDPSIAGRFSYEDALSYSHPNGWTGPRDGITIKHEDDLPPVAKLHPASAIIEAQAREIAALTARAEAAEKARDEWRDYHRALEAAIVGDTGLSAMLIATQARLFKPRAEAAEAKVARLVEAVKEARDEAHSVAHSEFDGVWSQEDFDGLTPLADAALAEIGGGK